MPDIRAFVVCPQCGSTKITLITYYRCESIYHKGKRISFNAEKVKHCGMTSCMDCNHSQKNKITKSHKVLT